MGSSGIAWHSGFAVIGEITDISEQMVTRRIVKAEAIMLELGRFTSFMLGAIAFRRNWFQTIPGSLGKTGFVVAGLSTILLFPLALSGGAAFLGHGSWQSAVYALWDSTFSMWMCLIRCPSPQSNIYPNILPLVA